MGKRKVLLLCLLCRVNGCGLVLGLVRPGVINPAHWRLGACMQLLPQPLDAPLVHPERGRNQQAGKQQRKQYGAVEVPVGGRQQARKVHAYKPKGQAYEVPILWGDKSGTGGGQKRDKGKNCPGQKFLPQ